MKLTLSLAALSFLCAPAVGQFIYVGPDDVKFEGQVYTGVGVMAGLDQPSHGPFPIPKNKTCQLAGATGGVCADGGGTDDYFLGVRTFSAFWAPTLNAADAMVAADNTDQVVATPNSIIVTATYRGLLDVLATDDSGFPCGPDDAISVASVSCRSLSTIKVKFQLVATTTVLAKTRFAIADAPNQPNDPESESQGAGSWVIRDLNALPGTDPIVMRDGFPLRDGPVNLGARNQKTLRVGNYQLEVDASFFHQEEALANNCTIFEHWNQNIKDELFVKLQVVQAPLGNGG